MKLKIDKNNLNRLIVQHIKKLEKTLKLKGIAENIYDEKGLESMKIINLSKQNYKMNGNILEFEDFDSDRFDRSIMWIYSKYQPFRTNRRTKRRRLY
jgi:hypothetical protein